MAGAVGAKGRDGDGGGARVGVDHGSGVDVVGVGAFAVHSQGGSRCRVDTTGGGVGGGDCCCGAEGGVLTA